MDGHGWTRRKLGRISGGLVASLVALARLDNADARKKKRKKRCRKLLRGCTQGGKRKCCGALRCGEPAGADTFACCKKLGAQCVEHEECCNDGLGIGCFEGACHVI